ncbi:hypothetical protein [Pseudomonas aeruginosa]|nr:hypothetical protein [Pseudomonas aeruginosa]
MELEELNPSALIGPQQDVESIERWAERNGISYGTARAWVYRGVLPSVKLGKLRMFFFYDRGFCFCARKKACFLFTLPNPSWHVLFRV